MLMFFGCIHVVDELNIPFQFFQDGLVFLQDGWRIHITESIIVFK